MAVPASVREAYEVTAPIARTLAAHIRQTVGAFCEREQLLFTGPRIKSLASVSEKIETGRFEKWTDLDDIVACSVVVPTAVREKDVLAFLRSVYETRDVRYRNSTRKPPDVFRFDTTRFIGALTFQDGLDLPIDIARVQFEVQIPTIFEHAWQVVTHDLVYKSADVDWGRQRLAAQLKAAVEQIDLLISSFEASAGSLEVSQYPDLELRGRLVRLFKGLVQIGVISAELVPESWSRFADNVVALVGTYSNRY